MNVDKERELFEELNSLPEFVYYNERDNYYYSAIGSETGDQYQIKWAGFQQGVRAAEPVDADIDEQLKAAGLLTVSELMDGQPMDGFVVNAGVNDLDTFKQWLEMRTCEIKRMQAKMHLDKREETELFEWVIAHNAAFNEVWVNFNAMLNKG